MENVRIDEKEQSQSDWKFVTLRCSHRYSIPGGNERWYMKNNIIFGNKLNGDVMKKQKLTVKDIDILMMANLP